MVYRGEFLKVNYNQIFWNDFVLPSLSHLKNFIKNQCVHNFCYYELYNTIYLTKSTELKDQQKGCIKQKKHIYYWQIKALLSCRTPHYLRKKEPANELFNLRNDYNQENHTKPLPKLDFTSVDDVTSLSVSIQIPRSERARHTLSKKLLFLSFLGLIFCLLLKYTILH